MPPKLASMMNLEKWKWQKVDHYQEIFSIDSTTG